MLSEPIYDREGDLEEQVFRYVSVLSRDTFQDTFQDIFVKELQTGIELELPSVNHITSIRYLRCLLEDVISIPKSDSNLFPPDQNRHDEWMSDEFSNIQGAAHRKLIKNATNTQEIVAATRLGGWNTISDKLTDIHNLIAEETEKGPMELESLRNLILFITNNHKLQNPEIGITPSKFAYAEWRISNRGILSMEFLPDGKVRFAAILRTLESKSQRWSVNGEMPPVHMLNAISIFLDEL